MNIAADRKITAVVFDVGGVLLDWDPRHLYRKLIPDPVEMEWFLSTVVSGFEGIAKPDRQIYELLLRRFSLDPAATLFADDSQVNVDGAAQAGMDAVLYTGPGPILSRLGLAAR